MLAQGKLLGEQQQHLDELDTRVNLFTNAISQTLMSHQNQAVFSSSLISCLNNFFFLGGTLCIEALCFNASCISLAKLEFTTAPVLKHPDPTKSFVVEMDASESGVGDVLSQHFGDKLKCHLVVISRKLSLAEQNYDTGNNYWQ